MGEKVLSSLPLEILIYFNKTFSVVFFLTELALFIYKGNNFLYPDGVFGLEIFFLFVYLALEHVRLFQASKGNKIEQIGPLLWSLFFAIGVIVIHIFYFQMQSYVLKLDRILNGIAICFISLELLLMILTSLTFYRDSKF